MDRPFLRLAPFKVEILRFNPLAVIFRGVISDLEIASIQELAKLKVSINKYKTSNFIFLNNFCFKFLITEILNV